MPMIASGAPEHTTHPAPRCPSLNGQCVVAGDHEEHWGPDNEIAAIRPAEAIQALASARLYSYADTPFEPPRLALGISGFDGDLSLAEVDQLAAGLIDFARRLQIQAAHLAAAQRMHEVNR